MNVISVDEYKASGIYTKEQAAKQTVKLHVSLHKFTLENGSWCRPGVALV